jgi:FkbH-like protein
MMGLCWLPEPAEWRERLHGYAEGGSDAWEGAVALAKLRLDFVRTNALDSVVRRRLGVTSQRTGDAIRLALLGSSTMAHLHAAIRVAGLRQGLLVEIYENAYGQYWQELNDPASALHAFCPDTVVFAFDGPHLAAGVDAALPAADAEAVFAMAANRLRDCWRLAHRAFACRVIQQTPLPVYPHLLGSNEHRLPGSRAHVLVRLGEHLRAMADDAGVDLLAVDRQAARDGLAGWHNPALWHHAKQEISPVAAPLYGDLLIRILVAQRGRSAKCLVVDLDNTLWGGVIGEDGIDGLVLGQGSALGEAFVAFQTYLRALSRRGVILAVCSKNYMARALEPFEGHPDMVLRREDIASFVANWDDKPVNLRAIAAQLNIGLDSLVFVDDSPFERALIRHALPMVAVPEMPDDPARFAQMLADAGYFEAVAVTAEDRNRSDAYRANREREALRQSSAGTEDYLRSLGMELVWQRLDRVGLHRTVQLINKTNQFNLTARRYTEDQILAVIDDECACGLQFRLVDHFGDNGIIAVVIGRLAEAQTLFIDSWLMSCRVLGREVERAMLDVVVEAARRLGAQRIAGEYIRSERNGLVQNHYAKLGFTIVAAGDDGGNRSVLDLAGFLPFAGPIALREA